MVLENAPAEQPELMPVGAPALSPQDRAVHDATLDVARIVKAIMAESPAQCLAVVAYTVKDSPQVKTFQLGMFRIDAQAFLLGSILIMAKDRLGEHVIDATLRAALHANGINLPEGDDGDD